MATINIGNLAFTHKGDYASGTAYVKNDVVYYSTNGNAYIAKQATQGNAPTNATYWNQFAQGSGGIWNAGLSLGSAGEAVVVNAAGNALEFGAAGGGKVLQVVMGEQSSNFSTTSSSYVGSNLELNITPSATSSKILLFSSFLLYNSSSSVEATIYSNGANIISGVDKFNRLNSESNYQPNSVITYLHSPNSTSNQNYIVHIRCSTGGTSSIDNGSGRGVIIAQEIGA